MRKTIMTVLLFLIAVIASGAEETDNQKLFAEYIGIQSQINQLKSQLDAANGEHLSRLRKVNTDLKMLGKGVFDEKTIRHYENNVKLHNDMANECKKFLEFAKITDAAERKRLYDKYDAERAQLLDKERAAGKPFRKKVEDLKKKFKKEQKLFDAAMEKYCLLPEGKYPSIVSKENSAQFYNGMVNYRWLDDNRQQAFFAFVTPVGNPDIKADTRKLYDNYPVNSSWPNMIEIWVGNFRVSFHIVHKEWQGEKKIAEILKDFIDLEGLAGIDPDGANTKLNRLIKSSIDCTENYYNPIRNESQKIVTPLSDRRVLVKSFIRRLKGPPADAQQIRRDKENLERYQKDTERFKRCLEIGTITDVKKRDALKQKLEIEKEKLNAEIKKLSRPYREKKRVLGKTAKELAKQCNMEKAMNAYFLDGSESYNGIDKKEIKVRSNTVVDCEWKNADDQKVCRAQLQLTQALTIPEIEVMSDDRYYFDHAGGACDLWVRYKGFSVYFSIENAKWLEKEPIDKIAKKFIDLDGLAKL